MKGSFHGSRIKSIQLRVMNMRNYTVDVELQIWSFSADSQVRSFVVWRGNFESSDRIISVESFHI